MVKQNLHTHTTFCDGKDTPEALILHAMRIGHDSIGFSGHSYMHYAPEHSMSEEGTEAYRAEIGRLKEKYADQIKIYCGIELDMYSVVDLSPYDYVIGAVHYLKIGEEYVGFDRPAHVVRDVIRRFFGGDGLQYAKAYYETLAKLPDLYSMDMVGHFDLITKHAEKECFFDTDAREYRKYALEALHALGERVSVFEVNTGAIARGYRTTPYPAPFIMRELKAMGCGLVISSDCHDKNNLNCHFDETEKYVRSFGFDHLLTWKDGRFEEVAL